MKVIIALSVLFLSFLGLLFFMSYPWSLNEHTSAQEIMNVETLEMTDITEKPSVIKIMTWNLGYLYGEGSEGPGYVSQSKEFYERKLAGLVDLVKEVSPDIVCLQEIDFDSQRSQSMDQAKILAERAGYPFVARAISWDANYIPFPYWPISRHFGHMKSGGAVLSKYPIIKNDVTLLQKPLSQPWWYNLFYLHRYLQRVSIEINGQVFKLMNLHLEAFDKKDRMGQIEKLLAGLEKEKMDFITGDFNMVPSVASKKKFSVDDDYENDMSFELMQKSKLSEVIPTEIYEKDESLYFTFPSSRPDRRLDYIFYQPGLKMMKAEILPSALSDHLPLKATFQINSPQFNPYSQ